MTYMSLHDLEACSWGKTHYFDRGTRRFFNARFGDVRGCDGSRYGREQKAASMVESCAFEPGAKRFYRALAVDFEAGRVMQIDARGVPSDDERAELSRSAAVRRLEKARAVARGLEAFFRALRGTP